MKTRIPLLRGFGKGAPVKISQAEYDALLFSGMIFENGRVRSGTVKEALEWVRRTVRGATDGVICPTEDYLRACRPGTEAVAVFQGVERQLNKYALMDMHRKTLVEYVRGIYKSAFTFEYCNAVRSRLTEGFGDERKMLARRPVRVKSADGYVVLMLCHAVSLRRRNQARKNTRGKYETPFSMKQIMKHMGESYG